MISRLVVIAVFAAFGVAALAIDSMAHRIGIPPRAGGRPARKCHGPPHGADRGAAGLVVVGMALPGRAVTGQGSAAEQVGTVARLGLTPLKGAAHLHPERVAVRRDEVVGDRRWALIQPVASGWRIVRTVESPGMTAVRARCDVEGVLELELPGGRWFVVEGDPVGAPAAGVVAEYWGRPADVHLVPGPWDAALSDLLGREVHLVTVDRAGAVVFAEPVSIVTTSSVREVARRAGSGAREFVGDPRPRPATAGWTTSGSAPRW